MKLKHLPGNTNWREGLSTLDLLIKLACIEKKAKKVLLMQSNSTKQVSARRSTVQSLSLQLVFPVPILCLSSSKTQNTILGRHNTQTNNIQHNYTQHCYTNGLFVTFGITTLSIKTLSTKTLTIKTISIKTTQHKDTQHRDNQHAKTLPLCWMSLCLMSLCWVPSCWIS